MTSIQKLEEIFSNIYANDVWNMGQNESKSGLGSTLTFTENIRNILIKFIKDNSINTMLDTSCGDWHWMKLIKDELCDYTGLDIVKNVVDDNSKLYSNDKIKFIHTDFLTFLKNKPDKSIDLILCRHTLEHLPTEYNLEFINECKRVAKYLFLTGYNIIDKTNSDLIGTQTYRPINLILSPYSDLLKPYYYGEFYDGPNNNYVPEMYMYIYKHY